MAAALGRAYRLGERLGIELGTGGAVSSVVCGWAVNMVLPPHRQGVGRRIKV
jgi:hypothetical protein